uniref:Lactoylglutathione lyase-like lyase n=1 Tax=Desulfovibrio sp. U5L TaxID=596152 RepID=I2Q7L2_9BACT
MKVWGLRHVGLVVSDLERALGLYRDALGLVEWRRTVESGSYIEQVTGLAGVELEWVKLAAPGGGLLELLHYRRPGCETAVAAPVNAAGRMHAALTVDDVDALYRTLPAMGVRCPSPPALSPDGKVKVLYCFDGDGTNLELVQEMD